jgi:hypothetical protein
LGSGVWSAWLASGSIGVEDFSFSGTSSVGTSGLDTSGSALIWNITIAASEASTVLSQDIKWV